MKIRRAPGRNDREQKSQRRRPRPVGCKHHSSDLIRSYHTPLRVLRRESLWPATVVYVSTNDAPSEVDTTAAMPLLQQWAARFGAPLAEHRLDAFRIYRDELLAWNSSRANLTAITDPDEVESRLFLESLWCAAALPSTDGARLIDIGSGGGFPGLPLAIAFPGLDVTLVEATSKKTQFLEHVIARLELSNAHAIHGRAEDLAHDPEHREVYDAAMARALAPLPALVELCLPFVKVGGLLIAPKGADAEHEIDAASNALSTLGGEVEGIILPDSDSPISADHRLVVIRKAAPTPETYPRRAGMPTRRPL